MIKVSNQSFSVNSLFRLIKSVRVCAQCVRSVVVAAAAEFSLLSFLLARIIHRQWSRLFAGGGVTACGLSVSVAPSDNLNRSGEIPGGQSCFFACRFFSLILIYRHGVRMDCKSLNSHGEMSIC
jgi:hypothetical protein